MKRRHLRRAALLALAVSLLAHCPALAHPHAYVVYSILLPLGPQGVERIGFVFTFDVLFSAVRDYRPN